jgi:ribonuclease R
VAHRRAPVATADLVRAARVSRDERARVAARLAALEAEGRLVRTKGDRFTVPERLDLRAGRLTVNPAGFAFCVGDDPDEDDVYVPAAGVRPAMHGDRVLVRIEGFRRRGRTEGRVTKVLQRGTTRVVGVLRHGQTASVVVPQEQRITVPIVVPRGAEGGAADGDMVVADLVRWPGMASEAEARVTTVLGPATDPRVETEAVIHAHGLPLEFPPEVAAAARRVPETVSAEAAAGRLDLRALPIVTIDGENARDFDDAVLAERIAGGFRLTVAVADVAAYVPAGGALDAEARARGTSVYFPDRVIPMLPEELSNGICSLRAHEDRLAKAVRIDFDARGQVRGATFHDAVIRSAARLTYTQVRQALTDRDPAVLEALGPLVRPLEEAAALAELLAARRHARGAIDFDLPEAEVILDLRGRPENIVRAERSVAHRLIEELMLAANEAVARELTRRKLAFLHRVHEPPAADGVGELARFLEGFGLRLKLVGGKASPAAFQAVLERVAGRPEERLVNTVLLRSMQQARYAAESFGHFGLATENYTHFTSPIRRYPDLVVHRILGTGRVPPDLVAIAEETSRRERVAMEAEREIVQLKKIQFMQDKVGEQYDGLVSGVANFGFFVELRDLFVEGLVHVSALGDDFYEHVEREHLLRGRRSRRTFRVGDPVRVEVAGVSIERRRIDFVLADTEPRRTGGWTRRRRSS